jgi:putative membrane-bound dehydrogenase-like protein
MNLTICGFSLRTIIALATMLQDAPKSADLVQSIEQQRGGRHWIDQPTDPPKSPEESAACFEIEPGFRIQLVASEPIVRDPVAIDFDQLGRMFVVEYGDYPVGPKDPNDPPLSQIVMLEDTNNDGMMDRRTEFAKHLKFCHSLLAMQNGILACTETQIVFLQDTDNDNVADLREVWFDGFTPAHPQMQIGCPRYGFDNWIYLTYGHGKVRCTRPGFESEPVEIPRVDFRFHPQTMKFEAVSGAGQFGNTIDNFGHRFFSSNRNPIMTDVLTMDEVRKNPFAGVSVGHTDVGPAGENTRVYPLVAMKSNWLSHAGTHTSACGVTAYRGGLFGPESDRNVFVCEPVGHLVTRNIIDPLGATLTARRARENADFLASTDTWFRPVSLATGPDGALYLADMYRLWVEHPKFVPDDVAAKMDWRAGEDKGRIWRIVWEKAEEPKPFVSPKSTDDLVAMLSDGNGWRRMLAQRRLVEEQRKNAGPELVKLLPNDVPISFERKFVPQTFACLHAFWALHGLGLPRSYGIGLGADPKSIAVSSLIRDGLKVARLERVDASNKKVGVSQQVSDPRGEVQFQAILGADWTAPNRHDFLWRSVPVNLDDPWIQRAWLIATPSIAADVADAVVRESQKDASTASTRSDFLKQLALNVAVLGDLNQLKKLAAVVGKSEESGQWWQTALVAGLADGLPQCQNASIPKSLAGLLQTPPDKLKDALTPIGRVVQKASEVAIDKSQSDVDRVAAMALMSHLPPEALTTALDTLLSTGESSDCQRAAIDAVRRSGRADLAASVLDRWENLNPQARSSALALLLLRKETTTALLLKMADGVISPAVVSIDQRLILLQNPDESIRTASSSLFGGTVSANRKEVADQYAKALELQGDATRGAAVFQKTCSKCHRINGVGHNVGPDISDTRARARDALLYDILDPNRRVDPQFTECIIVTTDGQLMNGLLIAESSESVTLRQPEGREQTLSRSSIEELKSSTKSLMPEGIEKDVSVEQMADLLAFLKNR